MAQVNGRVNWFNARKGYGFITDDETGKGIFVHYSAIDQGRKYLEKGDEVTFEIGDGAKGPEAHNVSIVNLGKKRRSRNTNRDEYDVPADEMN